MSKNLFTDRYKFIIDRWVFRISNAKNASSSIFHYLWLFWNPNSMSFMRIMWLCVPYKKKLSKQMASLVHRCTRILDVFMCSWPLLQGPFHNDPIYIRYYIQSSKPVTTSMQLKNLAQNFCMTFDLIILQVADETKHALEQNLGVIRLFYAK